MGSFIRNKTLGLFVKTKGLLSKPLYGGYGFIICLHRVLPRQYHSPFFGDNGMAVTPEHLDWMIKTVRSNGFEIVSMDEVANRLQHGRGKTNFVAFTLDDGFNDNLQYGLPVFEANKIPFTIYVTNCMPNGTATLWADDIERMVVENESIGFSYQGQQYQYATTNRAEKEKAYHRIRLFILDGNNLNNFNNRIAAALGGYQTPPGNFSLSWDQIISLSKNPLCTIGAHTLNHLPLAKLSEEDALYEMKGSKDELENKLQKEVIHFAYPYGSKNECSLREFSLAQKAGYRTAVTGRPANLFAAHKNHMFAIPRYPIGENTKAERLTYIMNGILQFSFNGFSKIVTN